MALRIDAASEHAHRAMPWTGGSFTIAFWMFRLAGATTARFLLGLLDTDDASPESTGEPRINVNTASGAVILAQYAGQGGATSDQSTATYSTSGWTQVVAKYTTSAPFVVASIEVFVNGTGTGSPGTGNRDLALGGTLDRLQIGSNTANHSNCDFAHFAFFDGVALSGAQITELQTKLPTAITGATATVYESLIGSEGGFTLSGGTINSTNDASLPALSGGGGPAITDEPDNTTVTAPATATFSATYTGSIDGYQWQQSTDGGTSWGSAPDGTGASGGAGSGGTLNYTTTATAVSTGNHRNGYRYRLQLNPSGTPVNSAAAVLTVNATPTGPTINTQPSNATVTEPGTASFTVAATTSGGSLTYQWQVSADSGSSWANVSDGTGATTASYTTSGTAVSTGNHRNGYQYRCIVSDDNGSTNSNAATLTVNAATSNNIRLRPGIELERGAPAASRTLNRWWVLTPDLTAISATGTSITLDTEGRPTIDINASAHYVVGDTVPMWLGEWTSETNALDRTVRSGLMWVPAIAQA